MTTPSDREERAKLLERLRAVDRAAGDFASTSLDQLRLIVADCEEQAALYAALDRADDAAE